MEKIYIMEVNSLVGCFINCSSISNVWSPTFFKISCKEMHTGLEKLDGKLWQNFNFWVT